eukprot:4965683-Pyramimonas_sp.AAC.1
MRRRQPAAALRASGGQLQSSDHPGRPSGSREAGCGPCAPRRSQQENAGETCDAGVQFVSHGSGA